MFIFIELSTVALMEIELQMHDLETLLLPVRLLSPHMRRLPAHLSSFTSIKRTICNQ